MEALELFFFEKEHYSKKSVKTFSYDTVLKFADWSETCQGYQDALNKLLKAMDNGWDDCWVVLADIHGNIIKKPK